jgi:hypothetical protein
MMSKNPISGEGEGKKGKRYKVGDRPRLGDISDTRS